MLIIKIIWWLWNQMFQYAYIKALSLKSKSSFSIDISWFDYYKLHKYSLDIFNIDKNYAKQKEIPLYENLNSNNKYLWHLYYKLKQFCKKHNPNHFVESSLSFDSNFLTINSWYLEWYFQTEKYFKDFENEIRKDFTFTLPLSKKSEEIRWKIENSNSISIHIRRWDYLKENNAKYHWICGLGYYKEAINYLEAKQKKLTYFFFSDDIERVKENLSLENAYYIDWNNGSDSRQDMQLMSLCKHNIIANSSFSRRWARLNKNLGKIVIAPEKWFADKALDTTDMLPKNRIKL